MRAVCYTANMRQFVYDKLIRNKILGNMLREGEKPQYHILDDKQYLVELKKKILEEAAEIDLDNPDKLVDELADLQEVIDSMLEAIGKSSAELAAVRDKKNAKVGSFDQRIYVDTVEIPDDNPWIAYLEKNPERYPEVIWDGRANKS